MTTSNKMHPADAADLALIPACKKFTATILKNNKPQTSEFDSLTSARLEAVRMNATANNSRKALVYAITDEGRAILVPASYGRELAPVAKPAPVHSPELAAHAKAIDAKAPKNGKPSAEAIAAAKAEAAERATVKAKAKAAKPAKAKAEPKAKAQAKAKPAAKKAKPEGKSKVEIVVAMLTGRKAVTRKDIAEAVEWPSINIKAICARKGMKLKQANDGTLSATAPKV